MKVPKEIRRNAAASRFMILNFRVWVDTKAKDFDPVVGPSPAHYDQYDAYVARKLQEAKSLGLKVRA